MDAYLQQDEDEPIRIAPNINGWAPADTIEQRDVLPAFGGQVPDLVPPIGHSNVWRACHGSFPHPNPVQALLYIDEHDYEQFGAAILQVWPELENDEWIHINVHDSWTSSILLDRNTPQLMIVNQLWFPAVSSWRGALIEIKYFDEDENVQENSIISVAIRTPMRKLDLLSQLGMLRMRALSYLEVNGQLMRSHDPPVFFGHGAFLYLQFTYRTETSSDGTILTPEGYYERSFQESHGESSSRVADSSLHLSDFDEQSSNEPDDDNDSRTGRPGTETRCPENFSTCHDVSNRVSHGLAQLSHSDDCKEHTIPTVISLEDLLETEFDQRGSDSLPSSGLPRRVISLSVLVPPVGEMDESLDVALPPPDALSTLFSPWSPVLCCQLPEECVWHPSTEGWLKEHFGVSEHLGHPHGHGKVLHLYTDGSAIPDEDKAAWAFAAFSSFQIDDDPDQHVFIGWLSGPLILEETDQHFIGATSCHSLSAEASALWWALCYGYSSNKQFVNFVFHFDALTVGRAMDADYNSSRPAVVRLRMLMQGFEALVQPWHVYTLHVKAHTGHPFNELVNTLAQGTLVRDFCERPSLDFRPFFVDLDFALRWLWLRVRLQHEDRSLPVQREGSLQYETFLKKFIVVDEFNEQKHALTGRPFAIAVITPNGGSFLLTLTNLPGVLMYMSIGSGY
eukprot:Skav230757  [mRNA]  locus=scaffold4515:61338:64414:+ [translate_table: standard]